MVVFQAGRTKTDKRPPGRGVQNDHQEEAPKRGRPTKYAGESNPASSTEVKNEYKGKTKEERKKNEN